MDRCSNGRMHSSCSFFNEYTNRFTDQFFDALTYAFIIAYTFAFTFTYTYIDFIVEFIEHHFSLFNIQCYELSFILHTIILPYDIIYSVTNVI
jgi:hypothetical protein